MKPFIAEDNICSRNLLKLVAHGNAIIAEILRLKDHIPPLYCMETKEVIQRYQEIILDFSYFKISENVEKKIAADIKLQDLDDDLKENFLELIARFFLLFENIYQYIVDVNLFIEQLNSGVFIQQNMDVVLKDIEGKQLLCESLYLYGAMLLLVDLYIPGIVRERLLVAFYRYSTTQSQSNVDDVCKLLRDTGYNQSLSKRPADYPCEYFGRITIDNNFVEKVVGKLRSEDVYNQLAVYTIPEHRSAAFATQGGMLFVCLFFVPYYLQNDMTKMREIINKFFPSNWIVTVYMGVTVNLVDYWDNFKAAKSALQNLYDTKLVKDIFKNRGEHVPKLISKIHILLKEGTLTDDFVLDNINKILNLIINSNFVLRWLMLHNSQVTFFDNNKRSKGLKDVIQRESKYDPIKLLELLVSAAELELKIREILGRLLNYRNDSWTSNKSLALEAINNLSELFSGAKSITKVSDNSKLKLWFDNISKQITSLSDTVTTKSIKKITQLIQALDEVEEFHGIKTTFAVVQILSEAKDALRNALKAASLKEEYLVTLETVTDISYAWCTIDLYTSYMQDSIRDNPAVTSRLRALFLKLASAMEIPLLRINQAHSDDLLSVSQYYSNELIKYIQKVLQIIPEKVFSIVEKIIELQTWTIKEVPTRLDKERLREFAQLDHRMEVAHLTHTASTFTSGILDMRSTLVGVIRVDPAELLETGLLNELSRHVNRKFEELLEGQLKKNQVTINILMPRLEKLADAMDGYRRSLEYIQDYINIHGLEMWQKQISTIISESVSKEISMRKGVDMYSPSAGFMGSLARQIAHLLDTRLAVYIPNSCAWFDIKSQNEIFNTKAFAKLHKAIGIVGLHGLDTLYAFMIKNQLYILQKLIRSNNEKYFQNFTTQNIKTIKDYELAISKGNKFFQQILELLPVIGTLQILRKHLAYQLNTCCKFDSAHLEATLRTFNESLLNEIRGINTESTKPTISQELLFYTDNHLRRCGLYNPYNKIYIKSMQEVCNVDMSGLLGVLLIAQSCRLQLSKSTGDLFAKKPGDNIDGFSILIGIHTVMHQSITSPVDNFIDVLCCYIKLTTENNIKMKSTEDMSEAANILRLLQLYCENFGYPFEKIQDKIPMTPLTIILNK